MPDAGLRHTSEDICLKKDLKLLVWTYQKNVSSLQKITILIWGLNVQISAICRLIIIRLMVLYPITRLSIHLKFMWTKYSPSSAECSNRTAICSPLSKPERQKDTSIICLVLKPNHISLSLLRKKLWITSAVQVFLLNFLINVVLMILK